MKIIVIGGGAAGFFAAISAKEHNQEAEVTILEKTSKFLGKVKISGGGRCNVTNATFNSRLLSENYPRGEKFLRKAFEVFNAATMVEWLESRGVALKTYPDNCIFRFRMIPKPSSIASFPKLDAFILTYTAVNR
jgi:predicted flavoprotein YhiN